MLPKTSSLLFAGFATLFAANLSGQTIISINMDENQDRRAMTLTDLAGVTGDSVRVANWNNLPSTSTITLDGADLVYDDGSTVGGTFSVTLTTPRQTFQGETSLTNDPQMYAGSTQVWNDQSFTIELSDIPFSNYEVYLYTTGGSNSRGGSIARTGGDTYYNRGGSSPDSSGNGYTLITTTTFNPSDPTSVGIGNYVHYEGLSGANQTFTITTLDMGDTLNQRMALHGFQIVQVPEPGVYALLIGSAALLGVYFRRRRQ